MATKTHAILASFFCITTYALIFTKSLPLIGVLHGPSDEINALDRHRSVQTEILSLSGQNEDITWPGDDVFEPYQNSAYQDHRALILRDAGVIASLFALVLAMVPSITSVYYTAGQRLYIFLMSLPLYIVPGLIGQLYFQKTIPIEIVLLKTCGLTKGLSYVGYCSIKSLLIGVGIDGPYSSLTLFHDLKVVVSAEFLTYIVLGLGTSPRVN